MLDSNSWFAIISWLHWRDLLEISCFLFFFYTILTWIAKSILPNVMLLVYGWSALLGGAYVLELHALHSVLLALIPLIATLCLIMHQDVVQRTLLVPKRIVPSKVTKSDDWFEIMLRACLQVVHTHGSVICIIERNDAVVAMLNTLAPFNVPLTDSLLRKALMLHESNSCLWIREPGYLVAVDATWAAPDHSLKNDTSFFEWQQQALLLTHKSDAIVLYVQGAQKVVSIVAQGSIVENLTFGTAIKILRHAVFQNVSIHKEGHEKNFNAVNYQ